MFDQEVKEIYNALISNKKKSVHNIKMLINCASTKITLHDDEEEVVWLKMEDEHTRHT